MPIEFRCARCNKLLRTGDDTAGKQAKCPECGAVMPIPMPGAGPSSPYEPMGRLEAVGSPFGSAAASVPPDSMNPYQSPAGLEAGPIAFAPAGQIRPTRIGFGETLSRTWEVFTERWGVTLAGLAIAVLLCIPFYAVFLGLQLLIVPSIQDQSLAIAVNVFAQILFQIFVLWISIGVMMFGLSVVRRQEPKFGLIIAGGRYLLPIILCAILTQIIIVLGLVLLIIPGIIFAMMLIQSQLLIIDRNMGVFDAMSTSRDVMVGNKMTVFGIWILVTILGYLFSAITCGIGLLGFLPYALLVHVVIYLGVTGQPTMLDRYAFAPEEAGGSPFRQPGASLLGQIPPGAPQGDSPFMS